MSRYLDEYQIGEQFESIGRTITEADVLMFACMTGDMHPNHTNDEYMKTSPFGRRIAHGLLGIAYAHGMLYQMDIFNTTGVAFLEVENWKFHKPIFLGDTIRTRVSMQDIRFSKSKTDRGIAKLFVELLNQKDEVVQSGIKNVMMYRKSHAEKP